MTNSWNFSSPSAKSKTSYFLLLLAAIGLADATYLTVSHFTGEKVVCSLVAGCDVVLSSQYSSFLGIPLAVYGLVYYATMFLLLYYFILTAKQIFWKLFGVVALIGFAITCYLVYLQVNVIYAICQFCMISAVSTTLIFLTTLIQGFKKPQPEITQPPIG